MSDQHDPRRGQTWKAYERPDAPQPESTSEAVSESAGSNWRVYGGSSDTPWLKPGASPPPVPYAPLQRSFRSRPSSGWRSMSLGKRLRAVGGGVVLVVYVLAQLVGLIGGGSDSASDDRPSAVQVAPDHAGRSR